MVKKDGEQTKDLLMKLCGKSKGLQVSLVEVEKFFYPDAPTNVDNANTFGDSLETYSQVMASRFMPGVEFLHSEQKQVSKSVSELKKAQGEVDHYRRKVKMLEEKAEKQDKVLQII